MKRYSKHNSSFTWVGSTVALYWPPRSKPRVGPCEFTEGPDRTARPLRWRALHEASFTDQ